MGTMMIKHPIPRAPPPHTHIPARDHVRSVAVSSIRRMVVHIQHLTCKHKHALKISVFIWTCITYLIIYCLCILLEPYEGKGCRVICTLHI